jgi:hypothetical protein
MQPMMRRKLLWMIPLLIGICGVCLAIESGKYRLLSISISEKLIVVSHIPSKNKYILDVASTKITVNGKPAEFRELKAFSIIQLKLELKKDDRKGIDIDGKAIEISVSDSVPVSVAQPGR